MLLRFRFKNFKCFRDEAEISFIAERRGDPGYGAVEVPTVGERVLTVAGIYGPNASGKSSVLEALEFLRVAVRSSFRGWPVEGPIPLERFLLDGASETAPLEMELDLVVNATRLSYRVVLQTDRVVEERLLAWPDGHQQTWLRREGQRFKFSRNFGGRNQAIADLTRPTALFLSVAAELGHEVVGPIFSRLVRNTIQMLHSAHYEVGIQFTTLLLGMAQVRPRLEAMLAKADLGIIGVELVERSNVDVVRQAYETAMQGSDDLTDQDRKALDGFGRFEARFVHSAPGSSTCKLPHQAESRGTQAWFSLLGPALGALDNGAVLLVDELQASLHPLLAAEIVRIFNDPASNPKGAQLLFTSHDPTLLGHVLEPIQTLRRDAVWFTEKAPDGAARLYPLTAFKPRKGENIERGYLQGRYGAVPYLAELARPRPPAGAPDGEE